MTKFTKLTLTAIAAGMLLTGCAKKVSAPTTVEIWHTYNGQQADALNDAANRFNASQKKYIVEVKNQDYSGFADTVYNAVANGIGPSIIFNYGTTAVDYANEGLAINIQNILTAITRRAIIQCRTSSTLCQRL